MQDDPYDGHLTWKALSNRSLNTHSEWIFAKKARQRTVMNPYDAFSNSYFVYLTLTMSLFHSSMVFHRRANEWHKLKLIWGRSILINDVP